MDSVVRAVLVYALLLGLFRSAGKRTLAHTTTFDLVLVLIISEAISTALGGDDYSLTNAAIIVVTLILLDIALSVVKRQSPRVEALIDGLPLVLFQDGRPRAEHMARERLDIDDILAAARERHGVTRVEDIEEAILERSGEISVILRNRPSSKG
ncbi:MAG TPA: YetF domain-containing protein [Methylomirabilota bacterium]|nr:YetF domain-containing protein [Methylomirabilota bacterium]